MAREIDQKDARTLLRFVKALQAAAADYVDPSNRQNPARFANAVLELVDDERLVRAIRNAKGRRSPVRDGGAP